SGVVFALLLALAADEAGCRPRHHIRRKELRVGRLWHDGLQSREANGRGSPALKDVHAHRLALLRGSLLVQLQRRKLAWILICHLESREEDRRILKR
ncbi:hypothetical protein B0H17DRAFT_1059865, partial [Mycena rosella]